MPSSLSRKHPFLLAGLFRRAIPHNPGEVAHSGAEGQRNSIKGKEINYDVSFLKCQSYELSSCERASEQDTHYRVSANTKVSKPVITNVQKIYNGSEHTHTYKMSEGTPTISVQQTVPSHQRTILGLPILHLTLSQTNPPWIQLLKMGIASIAAELCSNQPFAGRISLFQSNWKALTNDSWVLEMVIKGYHIPLISNPVQQMLPHCPRLPHKDQIALEDEIKSLLQKKSDSTPPDHTTGVLFQHVHGTQKR